MWKKRLGEGSTEVWPGWAGRVRGFALCPWCWAPAGTAPPQAPGPQGRWESLVPCALAGSRSFCGGDRPPVRSQSLANLNHRPHGTPQRQKGLMTPNPEGDRTGDRDFQLRPKSGGTLAKSLSRGSLVPRVKCGANSWKPWQDSHLP